MFGLLARVSWQAFTKDVQLPPQVLVAFPVTHPSSWVANLFPHCLGGGRVVQATLVPPVVVTPPTETPPVPLLPRWHWCRLFWLFPASGRATSLCSPLAVEPPALVGAAAGHGATGVYRAAAEVEPPAAVEPAVAVEPLVVAAPPFPAADDELAEPVEPPFAEEPPLLVLPPVDLLVLPVDPALPVPAAVVLAHAPAASINPHRPAATVSLQSIEDSDLGEDRESRGAGVKSIPVD